MNLAPPSAPAGPGTRARAGSPPVARAFNPWPYGILAAFAVFIAGAAAFVVAAVGSRSDLVTPDYYEQELRYQRRVDQLRRTQPWESLITVEFVPESRRLQLQLPPAHAASGTHGTVVLYRPSDAADDRSLPLALDAQGRQGIPVTDLTAGLWKVQLAWTAGGEEFYADRSVVIGKPGAL